MRPWFNRLLRDDVDATFKQDLPAFLKQEAKKFNEAAPLMLTPAEEAQLTEWYFSATGQEQLEGLLDAIWQQMASVADWAMPAHDARHAMFKVPAASLVYLDAEKIADAGRLGIFGALLHDHGRWAEERIFGAPGESMIHARLSFLLARELTEEFKLPALAANQILHATIQHTAGGVPADPMALKLTVTADRDQLYGPEMVMRLMHHIVVEGATASVYGEKPGLATLDRLMHFLVNRIPGPLFSREEHVTRLHMGLATFLLMAEPEEDSRLRFAARRAPSPSRRSLPDDFDWERAWHGAHAGVSDVSDPHEALRSLLNAPNVVSNPLYMDQALGKLSALPAHKAPLLAKAFAWAERERRELDAIEVGHLKRIAMDYASDKPVALLANRLVAHGYVQP